MNTSNHRNSRIDTEGITSETMENKDPAINQHQNVPSNADKYSNSDKKDADKNDEKDPYFQKNSSIAKDLDEDLKKVADPDRKKKDEYSINTPGTVGNENGENNENN